MSKPFQRAGAVRNPQLRPRLPRERITANLAPADIRKAGPAYDLAIAVGVLIACEQASPRPSRTRRSSANARSTAPCATCGYHGDPVRECTGSPSAVTHNQKCISEQVADILSYNVRILTNWSILTPMSRYASERSARFYAQTYDASVSDWPGEIAFYRALTEEVCSDGSPVLELACGTGRVAIQLAQGDVEVAGLDLSRDMLDVARMKSSRLANLRWVEGDMRSFDLSEVFGLIIIPGHAFQNLLTPEDQLACLRSIKQHLVREGVLVVHLDHPSVDWLGDLIRDKGNVFEEAEQFQHPETGRQVRTFRAWSYEPSTQTAIVQTVWEEIDADGQIMDRWESGPIRIHCVFRFEIEHLLRLAGYDVDAVYGDFFRGELTDESEEMVWVARG